MTTITRNLPWFIRDLGVSIVGRKCYTSLIENLDIGDVECIKYSISKGLGIGIVLGGSIMKVPQLILIVKAKSARGLSLPAYILETLSYAITLAYASRNDFPFSTYGENLFLTIQNLLITLLIIVYAPKFASKSASIGPAVVSLLALPALAVIPLSLVAMLQLTTLPLSLFSKLPQIRQNHRARSTGQLSAFAVGSQVAGCAARLFTTATEVGDTLVAAGFALALALNVVLGVQLWMYWGRDDVEAFPHVEEKKKRDETPPWQQQPERAATPPWQQRTATPPPAQAGRKWARKVD
ncbi:hypothetical protein FB451DRAFT_1137866 [Mycena latifolia]|nr:hypothetical protein FB451DRAFT_1137866 [Mycena latifolia]